MADVVGTVWVKIRDFRGDDVVMRQPFRARSYVGRAPGWAWYLALSGIPMVLGPWLLTSQWAQSATTTLLGYAACAACVWGYRTGRDRSVAWLWIGAGVALNASGSIVEAIETQVLGSTAIVTPADALYLSLYPCLAIGLLLIVRARYPGLAPAKLLDAGVLTVGLGLLCWIYLIRPAAAGATGSTFARIVTIAYPVGDLMLLAVLARLIASESWRVGAVRLMLFALLGFLLGDSAWALVNQNGWSVSDAVSALLGDSFLIAYAMLGAAALHPSAGQLGQPAREERDGSSRLVVTLLVLASLVAPAVLFGQALAGRVSNGIAIAIASAQLTLLVGARVSYLLRRVQRQAERLRELTLEDALTGLPNRRALDAYLGETLPRARRSAHPVSVALIDLDRFKLFNDEYGHLAGDQLLKSVASAWSGVIRETDMLARLGGEEFVLVLPGADLLQAEAVLHKLRACAPLGQTFSAGLASWDSEVLPEELIRAADGAMYAAKRAGRDRIALAN